MSKPVSPHIQFYTSFGRPIAKVFLGAICTYQATYWLWTKLENEEVKRSRVETIRQLEGELNRALEARKKEKEEEEGGR